MFLVSDRVASDDQRALSAELEGEQPFVSRAPSRRCPGYGEDLIEDPEEGVGKPSFPALSQQEVPTDQARALADPARAMAHAPPRS